MVSPLVRSIALATILVSSPTRSSLAFTATTTQPQRGQQGISSSRFRRGGIFDPTSLGASPSSSSSSSEEDGGPSSSSSSSSMTSSSREDRLGETTIDLLPPMPRGHVGQSSTSSSDVVDRAAAIPRSSEFDNLESPPPMSAIRLARLESERRSLSAYVRPGTDEYWDLMDEIMRLEDDLHTAAGAGVSETALSVIRRMLVEARSKDPEYVYRVASNNARVAERVGGKDAVERYREEGNGARRMLPQFNLEGLWVGKYGSHGFEMINVTYSGDRLVAYKVTGDKNIPRGEITFTADLSPPSPPPPVVDRDGASRPLPGSGGGGALDPIHLSEASARKWGTRRLSRFRGSGHAAEPGFANHQFMEGQMVVIGGGDYFSFAWVPLEHQIFFGRPSPELALRMLREGGGASLTAGVGLDVPGPDAGIGEMTAYVGRCLEVTCDNLLDESREGKVDPFSCIWHGDDDEYCYFE